MTPSKLDRFREHHNKMVAMEKLASVDDIYTAKNHARAIDFNGETGAFTKAEWNDYVRLHGDIHYRGQDSVIPVEQKSVVPAIDNNDMPASEALIRAREAVIACQYVVGLDAEMQIRAGMHDDWQVLQIAYHALLTKNLDLDVLRKYHGSGQLAVVPPAAAQVVVKRERRSFVNILIARLARWVGAHFQRRYENVWEKTMAENRQKINKQLDSRRKYLTERFHGRVYDR